MLTHANDVLSLAAGRIVNTVAGFIPGLLALLIILIFTVLAAFLVSAVLRRVLQRVRFDDRVTQWGVPALAGWEPARSPSRVVAQLSFWIVVLLGLLAGISALDPTLTSLLVVRLFDYMPKVAAAAAVTIAGFLLARFLARSVLINAVNLQIQSARLLSLGVKWLVMVLTSAMAMDHLGIGGPIVQLAFAILFGGIVLTLSLALGLGSKEMVSRSWERQADKNEREPEEQFHHL
jgi:hypothetical protein